MSLSSISSRSTLSSSSPPLSTHTSASHTLHSSTNISSSTPSASHSPVQPRRPSPSRPRAPSHSARSGRSVGASSSSSPPPSHARSAHAHHAQAHAASHGHNTDRSSHPALQPRTARWPHAPPSRHTSARVEEHKHASAAADDDDDAAAPTQLYERAASSSPTQHTHIQNNGPSLMARLAQLRSIHLQDSATVMKRIKENKEQSEERRKGMNSLLNSLTNQLEDVSMSLSPSPASDLLQSRTSLARTLNLNNRRGHGAAAHGQETMESLLESVGNWMGVRVGRGREEEGRWREREGEAGIELKSLDDAEHTIDSLFSSIKLTNEMRSKLMNRLKESAGKEIADEQTLITNLRSDLLHQAALLSQARVENESLKQRLDDKEKEKQKLKEEYKNKAQAVVKSTPNSDLEHQLKKKVKYIAELEKKFKKQQMQLMTNSQTILDKERQLDDARAQLAIVEAEVQTYKQLEEKAEMNDRNKEQYVKDLLNKNSTLTSEAAKLKKWCAWEMYEKCERIISNYEYTRTQHLLSLYGTYTALSNAGMLFPNTLSQLLINQFYTYHRHNIRTDDAQEIMEELKSEPAEEMYAYARFLQASSFSAAPYALTQTTASSSGATGSRIPLANFLSFFLSHHPHHRRRECYRLLERLHCMFDALDSDKDGVISCKELEEAFSALHTLSPARIQSIYLYLSQLSPQSSIAWANFASFFNQTVARRIADVPLGKNASAARHSSLFFSIPTSATELNTLLASPPMYPPGTREALHYLADYQHNDANALEHGKLGRGEWQDVEKCKNNNERAAVVLEEIAKSYAVGGSLRSSPSAASTKSPEQDESERPSHHHFTPSRAASPSPSSPSMSPTLTPAGPSPSPSSATLLSPPINNRRARVHSLMVPGLMPKNNNSNSVSLSPSPAISRSPSSSTLSAHQQFSELNKRISDLEMLKREMLARKIVSSPIPSRAPSPPPSDSMIHIVESSLPPLEHLNDADILKLVDNIIHPSSTSKEKEKKLKSDKVKDKPIKSAEKDREKDAGKDVKSPVPPRRSSVLAKSKWGLVKEVVKEVTSKAPLNAPNAAAGLRGRTKSVIVTSNDKSDKKERRPSLMPIMSAQSGVYSKDTAKHDKPGKSSIPRKKKGVDSDDSLAFVMEGDGSIESPSVTPIITDDTTNNKQSDTKVELHEIEESNEADENGNDESQQPEQSQEVKQPAAATTNDDASTQPSKQLTVDIPSSSPLITTISLISPSLRAVTPQPSVISLEPVSSDQLDTAPLPAPPTPKLMHIVKEAMLRGQEREAAETKQAEEGVEEDEEDPPLSPLSPSSLSNMIAPSRSSPFHLSQAAVTGVSIGIQTDDTHVVTSPVYADRDIKQFYVPAIPSLNIGAVAPPAPVSEPKFKVTPAASRDDAFKRPKIDQIMQQLQHTQDEAETYRHLFDLERAKHLSSTSFTLPSYSAIQSLFPPPPSSNSTMISPGLHLQHSPASSRSRPTTARPRRRTHSSTQQGHGKSAERPMTARAPTNSAHDTRAWLEHAVIKRNATPTSVLFPFTPGANSTLPTSSSFSSHSSFSAPNRNTSWSNNLRTTFM